MADKCFYLEGRIPLQESDLIS